MSEYLLDYVRKNIWCNSEQDNQFIIAAARVTKKLGELNRFKYVNKTIDLPTTSVRYHVFSVGQINPDVLGLLSDIPSWANEKWVRFDNAMNQLKLFINIYTTSGVEIPRFTSYYMHTNDRGLIFAIQEDPRINIDYQEDTIYFRFYTNAYFQTNRADTETEYIYCKGDVINNSDKSIAIQMEYESYVALNGFVFCYRNGMTVDRLDGFTMSVGDIVEFVYDSSIKRKVEFNVSDLNVFESILDNKFKYLLHYNDGLNDNIDYQDDIDIHILAPTSVSTRFEGCYYHRNAVDSHRMVTHRDYSIVVDYFTFIANKINDIISETPLDIGDFKVRVVIRDSGYYRPLVYENNRLFELYKLNDTLALAAMVGLDSTVDEWKAEVLENSAYSLIMRSKYKDINDLLVREALGYNAISKVLGDTPAKTILDNTLQTASLPNNLRVNSTVYEYDADGYLLGVHGHVTGTDYEATDANTRLIEAISGVGSNKPEVIFGTDNLDLPTTCNYRVYRCYYLDGVPDNQWEDITDSEFYTVVDNKLVWNNLDSQQFLMIRNDNTFLDYDLELEPLAGTLFFTLSEIEDRGDGDLNYILPVPLGEIDVFMNGKSLIRNLDYIVHFPKVYIINKSFLIQPADVTTQHIHVRFTGFCKPDLSMDDIEDFGFIEHGFLSNNNRHDVRDDKVLRIITNGKTRHRDDITFSEQHDGISVVNSINGNPYQIKDIVVPLRSMVNENTYSLRDKSIIIDNKISDYLTIKLPQPERNAVSSISNKYVLVSPFFNRIIHGLYEDTIDSSRFMENLTDMDIMFMCSQFEPILPFDPITEENNIDNRYVIIHPHSNYTTIGLTIYKYRFLTRVVKLYGRGLIDISSFVILNPF